MSSVWIFMAPLAAWLPWTLWGVWRLVGMERGNRFLLPVLGLTAAVAVGHPQMAAYFWLCAALFGVLCAIIVCSMP
jgi:hypothetical protein